MPERLVFQKLLAGHIATAIVENGYDQVGGFVASASAVAGLRTPAELLAAYGVEASPDFVDVVRFEQPRMSTVSEPGDMQRPWQTFPNGFLLGTSLARVWSLGRTRYSYGAEYWRIRSDGEQKCLSRYEGAARGWVGARQWRPPSAIVGTMARWRDGEFFADVTRESVLLTTIADNGPGGFEQVHPRVWSRSAALSDCDVFERIFTAELDGVPVRLLRTTRGPVEVLLLTDDPEAAARVGAGLVEPGVYEIVVDSTRLANIQGVENQLAPSDR